MASSRSFYNTSYNNTVESLYRSSSPSPSDLPSPSSTFVPSPPSSPLPKPSYSISLQPPTPSLSPGTVPQVVSPMQCDYPAPPRLLVRRANRNQKREHSEIQPQPAHCASGGNNININVNVNNAAAGPAVSLKKEKERVGPKNNDNNNNNNTYAEVLLKYKLDIARFMLNEALFDQRVDIAEWILEKRTQWGEELRNVQEQENDVIMADPEPEPEIEWMDQDE